MKKLYTAILLILAFGTIFNAKAQQPELPEGFDWQRFDEVEATFLIPDGWNYISQTVEGTHAYFITKENLEQVNVFKTGLSVNVIPNIDEISGMSAEEFALVHVNTILEQDGILLDERWRGVQGPLHSYGIRYSSENAEGEMVIMHQLNIGNEQTGTLYIILFEAPEKSWNEAWSKGEVMFNIFSLNPEI